MNNVELAWYANLDKLPSPDLYICDYDWAQRYNDLYWFRQNHLFDSYCDLYIWKKTFDTLLVQDQYFVLLASDKDNNSHTCICDGIERIAEVVTRDFAINPRYTNWFYSYTHLVYPFETEEKLAYSIVEFDDEGLMSGKYYNPRIERSDFNWLYDRICIPF